MRMFAQNTVFVVTCLGAAILREVVAYIILGRQVWMDFVLILIPLAVILESRYRQLGDWGRVRADIQKRLLSEEIQAAALAAVGGVWCLGLANNWG